MIYRNSEGYADPTAGAAFAHIEYEERLKKRQAKKKRREAGKKNKRAVKNRMRGRNMDSVHPHAVWVQA